MKRIYRLTEEAAREYPNVEFLAAPYLADHRLVVETVLDRITATGASQVPDNCGLCKYRERIVGFEGSEGAPQVGHHHHVRGILKSEDEPENGEDRDP